MSWGTAGPKTTRPGGQFKGETSHPTTPPSLREFSGGGGGGEGVGKGSRKESLASPTSIGRRSVGEEPPAERYEYRGTGS